MQPTFGDSLRILPKPLPAALVNMQANTSEDSNGNDKSDKDEVSLKITSSFPCFVVVWNDNFICFLAYANGLHSKGCAYLLLEFAAG